MAEIRAFRGYRYDLGRVGSLSDVIAPPYDVIDSVLQAQLYARSPFNAVRVELTQEMPGDTEQENKYTRASATLKDWLSTDILRQDSARSLYVYEQEFTVEGRTYTRRGFLARVKLEPFGTGRIFPHEQTLSGPKADRLKLYHATNFNISPIFGLYPDAENEVFNKIEPLIRRQPPVVATDHLGVINRLWVVTDSSLISSVIGQMGPKPVFIADGHHRYETGLRYRDDLLAEGLVEQDEAAPNFCLMMLVSMNDPGLVILPTHRLISGLPAITGPQLLAALAVDFEVFGQYASAQECWEVIEMEAAQDLLGFGTVADGQWHALRFKNPRVMQQLAPEHTEEWQSLAVSILHKAVIEKGLASHFHTTPTCRYVHLMQEVTDAILQGQCQIAALVPPVCMDHVETIAGHRETMPPKSTYFYPKLLTGMVFNALRRD